MKRLLSCTSSEMLKMDGQELKQAILASEGRTSDDRNSCCD